MIQDVAHLDLNVLDNIEMNKSLTDHVEWLMREKTIDEVAAEK